MNAIVPPRKGPVRPGDPVLAQRLAKAIEGEVLFDVWSRGRYSTDASIYQIEPVGVVVPKTAADVAAAIAIARDAGVSVLPRGGGTSQCGQTVGESLVIDTSKYLDKLLTVDPLARTASVEPGLVLDVLNKKLRPHGLFFPVDVSPSNRATIGGMTGNNSCGARSIRYGNMVHNVRGVDAILADGSAVALGEVPADNELGDAAAFPPHHRALIESLRALHRREAGEIAARFPKLLRRVGGYNLDQIADGPFNLARLFVGSEGTLGFATRITLDLQPLPAHRVLGVCHFATLRAAMEATAPIVELKPSAVELVDMEMLHLARLQPQFKGIVERFVTGDPAALLLVEFAGEDLAAETHRLKQLVALLGDLGAGTGHDGGVLQVTDPAFQRAIWEVRKAGLNILMAMKGEGKPVSFVEDCAVALADLPDYTDRLSAIFAKYGTRGTWYAHASVGTLHVRPILNMKEEAGAKAMRGIAEECFAMVREYKGSHSGEHGDGIVRSEFHEKMFGTRLVRAFEAVKDSFDPTGLFNPGKIVRPFRMDDRTLFRYKPDYRFAAPPLALDWSEWHGFAGAIEMCNNNGACRKAEAGVMCPSYRATGEEGHSTRGRANSLRLALSGQLGASPAEALASPEMAETMRLCVGCKGCKRECPTGVDMARLKIEVLHHQARVNGVSLRDRLFAYLPRYAGAASALRGVVNAAQALRDAVPLLARFAERRLGIASARRLPRFRRRFSGAPLATSVADVDARSVILFADTFTAHFEPENAAAAQRVLERLGYRVLRVAAADGGRPLCCGRTFLSAGLVEEARHEARRMLDALSAYAAKGVPLIGLEPACLFTLKDEFAAMFPGEADALARVATSFEEFVEREAAAGRCDLGAAQLEGRALVHGHCHQKAFGAFGSVTQLLKRIGGLKVEAIDSTCCGMAGSFGYEAENYAMSLRIGELGVLPAVRAADADTFIVADGTSCRQQIADGAARPAIHAARLLDRALQ